VLWLLVVSLLPAGKKRSMEPHVIYVIDGNDVGNQSQKPVGVLARTWTFEYLADDTDRPASNNWALWAWTESAEVDRAWGQSSRSATNVSDKATRQPITAARWRSSMNVSDWQRNILVTNCSMSNFSIHWLIFFRFLGGDFVCNTTVPLRVNQRRKLIKIKK